MNKNILITGGTGLVGSHLVPALLEKGYKVSLLSRSTDRTIHDVPVFKWDLKNKHVDEKAFQDAGHIIHLAGSSVVENKWTQEEKREIVDSRVKSSELLYYLLRNNKHNIQTIVSSSAVGYYGDSGARLMREDAIAGYDFLANTCRQWEHAVNKMAELGIRTVNMRTGIVLAAEGGAVPALVRPIKFYVGAPLGDGNQYVSWIHIDDLVNMYIKAIEDPTLRGPYNAVAPNPVINKELVRTIAKILDKPLWLPPIPAGVLRAMLGERASFLLGSINVSSEKIVATGFLFKHKEIKEALESILLHE